MKSPIIFVTAIIFIALVSPSFAGWTTPVPVTAVNTQLDEMTPYQSYDGLSLYFSRPTDQSVWYRIFEAKRDTPTGPFTSVSQVLQSSGTNHHLVSPWVSQDNLRMYYHSESTWQIKVSQRASVSNPWPQGTMLTGLPTSGSGPGFPSLSQDELTMVFCIGNAPDGKGSYDMLIATRPDRNSSFGNVRFLTELNTVGSEGGCLSSDALTIYFDRGDGKIYSATRSTINDLFGNLQQMPAFDIPGRGSYQPRISGDGTAMYFISTEAGQLGDIYVSYIPEPATILLLTLGGLLLRKKRR